MSCFPVEPGYGRLHLLHVQPKKSSEVAWEPGLKLILYHGAWLFPLSWLTDFRKIIPKGSFLAVSPGRAWNQRYETDMLGILLLIDSRPKVVKSLKKKKKKTKTKKPPTFGMAILTGLGNGSHTTVWSKWTRGSAPGLRYLV